MHNLYTEKLKSLKNNPRSLRDYTFELNFIFKFTEATFGLFRVSSFQDTLAFDWEDYTSNVS